MPHLGRIKRLADELRMRRRPLDVYRNSPPWPGKDRTFAFEQARLAQAGLDVFLPHSSMVRDAPGDDDPVF